MILYMIKKFDEFINENIFDGIGKRSKGGVVRKENYVDQVDLGLPSGTIWATCNLGASSPEEYGDYYAWGETEQKNRHSWENYKFGTRDNLTKYNREDGKIILDPEDDVAHVVLGGKWHIPTKEQIQELLDNTTIKKSKLNGVKGRLFKSKINGNTLFFPYSGYKSYSSVYGKDETCFYWSSSLTDYSFAMTFYCGEYNDVIDVFDIDKYHPRLEKFHRYLGFSVRGVLDKK